MAWAVTVGIRALLRNWLRGSLFVVCLAAVAESRAQLPYIEAFDDDGDGTRYTVTGRGFALSDNLAPAYWAQTDEIGEVRVPGSTAPAKRAAILWDGNVDPSLWTDDALDIFDGVVNWAIDNMAGATIGFVPGSTGTSDTFLADRFIGQGHDVIDLGTDAASLPDPSTIDLVIASSTGNIAPPTGFNAYAVPVITYNAGNHDDIQVSSIGAAVTVDPSQVNIVAENEGHPAASGKQGTIPWTTSPVALQGIGDNFPSTATIIATYDVVTPANVENLSRADGMFNGSIPSTMAMANIEVADLVAGESGNWTMADSQLYDNPVPGAATGGFAILGTGTINVTTPDTFTFVLSGDDGGRLRIDLNQDGVFDNSDNIIVDDAQHALQDNFGDATFPSAGAFGFEWVGFNSGGNFGSEVSVAINPGGNTPGPVDFASFEPLGDTLFNSNISLDGTINVQAFYPDEPPTVQQFPAVMLIEEGGDLLGGTFTRGEGEGFFAASDLDFNFGGGGFNATNPRSIELNPVDVSGGEDLQLTIALAAADIDFEVDDYLRILIDKDGPNGPADFEVLDEFIGTTPKTGAVTNGEILLSPDFQDVSYDLPADATNLVVRIEAHSTFTNEIWAFDDIRIGPKATFLDSDFNKDGNVDLQDFNILKGNFGSTNGTMATGDANMDGNVDLQDFNVLKGQFGQSAAATVPEPSTFFIAAVGTFGLCLFWRRRLLV